MPITLAHYWPPTGVGIWKPGRFLCIELYVKWLTETRGNRRGGGGLHTTTSDGHRGQRNPVRPGFPASFEFGRRVLGLSRPAS